MRGPPENDGARALRTRADRRDAPSTTFDVEVSREVRIRVDAARTLAGYATLELIHHEDALLGIAGHLEVADRLLRVAA